MQKCNTSILPLRHDCLDLLYPLLWLWHVPARLVYRFHFKVDEVPTPNVQKQNATARLSGTLPVNMRKRVVVIPVTGRANVQNKNLLDYSESLGWGYVDIEFCREEYRLFFENKPGLPHNKTVGIGGAMVVTKFARQPQEGFVACTNVENSMLAFQA